VSSCHLIAELIVFVYCPQQSFALERVNTGNRFLFINVESLVIKDKTMSCPRVRVAIRCCSPTAMIPIALAIISLLTTTPVQAFSPAPYRFTLSSALSMVGKGWDNSNYLDNLGGSEEDREQETKSYKEFSDARAETMARNNERMNSPQAKAFMEQQQRLQMKRDENNRNENYNDDSINVPNSSQGGSRFGRMMMEAKTKGRGMSGSRFDMEQKFGVPLDDGDIDNVAGGR
jgi:hypothetical protein